MKKSIAFDSSTMILLAKISLLRGIAAKARCIITDAVKGECTRKDTDDAKIIIKLIEEGLIKVVYMKPAEFSRMAKDFNIRDGEASSLALSLNKKYILATDDKPAIKACTILGIDFTTAIHFVVRAHARRIITKDLALEKITGLGKYGRYSPRIIEDAIKRIRGDKNG